MGTAVFRTIVVGAALAWAMPIHAHEPHSAAATARALPAAARAPAATIDAFHAALRRGDTKGALDLLADDVLILEGGGAERSKAEYAAEHLGADAEYSRAVETVVTRRSGGSDGTTAWIASEGRSSGSFRGKAVDRITAETMVLRRFGKRWKITHIHWSSAAPR